MKTKFISFVLLTLIVFSAGVRAAAIEIGQTLRGVLPITGQNDVDVYATLPLPEGEWIVGFTKATASSNGKNLFRSIALYQTDEGRVKQGVYANVKVQGPGTQWIDEPCKDASVLFKNDYGTRLWKQKCLVIRTSAFLQSSNETSRTSLATLSAKDIKTDFNSLTVRYTRYGDGDKFYIFEIHVFPSTYGLENPVISVLSASPWAAHNYVNDPEKVRFIDALKAYAETVVIDLDRAYDTGHGGGPIKAFAYNRTDQASKLVATDPGSTISSERPAGNDASSSIEKRLSGLKKIYEQGLLSKEEYDEKRKSILNSL